jgi:hypothetical protein
MGNREQVMEDPRKASVRIWQFPISYFLFTIPRR